MDDSWVLESFDSLWFFSNIFSSRIHLLGSADSDEKDAQIHEKEFVIEESSIPISPILEIQTDESSKAESEGNWCHGYDEFAAEIEQAEMFQPVVVIEEVEIRSPESEEKRRSKSRRKRQRRKILGEMDLGDYRNEDVCFGYWNFEEIGIQNHNKMPPLSDGMAMKQHLKSWAYAVACTVK